MGLAKGALKVLLKEASRRPYKGRVLTLGRQDIYFSYDALRKTARDFGVPIATPSQVLLNHKPEAAAQGFISDQSLFEALGFSEVMAMDYSDYEGAKCVFDLNESNLPAHLVEAFDLVVDGGTLEHVFHLPNALHNIFKMIKVEGRVIHILPVANYVDHGFYMFSPTLFWEYYQANKFEINTMQVFRHTRRPDIDPWEISNYRPGCLEPISFGGLDDGMYSLICIATKKVDSTATAIPQQGKWLADWLAKGKQAAGSIETNPEPIISRTVEDGGALVSGQEPVFCASLMARIKDKIKRVSWLYRLLLPPVRWTRSLWPETACIPPGEQADSTVNEPGPSKGLGLKIVDRY